MPKNRIIYNTEALFVGPTGRSTVTGKHTSNSYYNQSVSDTYLSLYGSGAGAQATTGTNLVAELYRVQSANWSFNKNLRDVNQYGELKFIDRIAIDPPTVSLDFSFLQNSFANERAIGFDVNRTGQLGALNLVPCLSGYLTNEIDGKNFFLKLAPEGVDVKGEPSNDNAQIVALGNGFITQYQAQGSVGNFPTVTVSVQALNYEIENQNANLGSGFATPAVFPTDGTAVAPAFTVVLPTGNQSSDNLAINTLDTSRSVLRPGDIILNLGLGADDVVTESDIKIQSYQLTADLSRSDLSKLGSKYAFAKVINFPASVRLSVTADVGDLQAGGSLITATNTGAQYSPTITLRRPGTSVPVLCYKIAGASFDGADFSSSIGSNMSTTINFTSQISSATDSTAGLFLSGAF